MAHQKIPVFRGDSSECVNMLVAACERKACSSEHSGFGRELVPYFDEAQALSSMQSMEDRLVGVARPPLSLKKRASALLRPGQLGSCLSSALPPHLLSHARRLRFAQKSSSCGSPPRGASSKKKNFSASRTTQVSPQPCRHASTVSSPVPGADASPLLNAARYNFRCSSAKRTSASAAEAACPGLFACSPKPENLPMPKLLSKSLLKQSVGEEPAAVRAHQVVPCRLAAGLSFGERSLNAMYASKAVFPAAA